MIPGRMSRPRRVLFVTGAIASIAALVTACSYGTQKISVPRSQTQLYHGAVLFSQRCSGCHSLSYAATHGSAANVRTAQENNGPDFNVRCERPVDRVLYAIENGGFSGAIMPQNVVVGQDAVDVAEFVATYSGRKAMKIPGVTPCQQKPVGSINAAFTTTTTTTSPTAALASKPATTAAKHAASKTAGTKKTAGKSKAKAKHP
jgi:mono/diheme cytochrome c family protein